jgi:peptide/nickel transport system substrate-binding protein
MRKYSIFSILVILSMILGACAKATPEIIRETVEVKQTQIVKETQVIKETQVVKEEVKVTQEVKVVVTATPVPTATTPPMPTYGESPMLAEKVKAGQLPPVGERLPANPRVIKALTAEEGAYGGELRVGFTGTSPEWGGLLYIAAWDNFVQWKSDFNGYEYNLAEAIDVNPEVTEYTIHLRKGLKWSDGEPYTADDIMFYINDVMFNQDLSPSGPIADWLPTNMATWFRAEKLDDFTVKLIFPRPYGSFLYFLAGWQGRYFIMYPKHYLMQFHKKYNPNVDELVKADGSVTDWMALFFKKGPDTWANPGRMYDNDSVARPSMYAWITTQPLGTGTQLRMERNPYYWKVDEKGNQLPYIDTILGISYQDNESRTLAMLNGDLDWNGDSADANRVLYHDAVAEGKPIQIKYPLSDGANVCSIHFNLTLSDTVKAEVFNNLDFRIGMSYAINRPEVIEIILNGQGTPAQVAPLNDSPFYIEGMDTQYTEYDVAKANEYLDKMLPNKGADGFRLGPDGKKFTINFIVQNDLGFGTWYVQLAELLKGYWNAVGVDVLVGSQAGAQYEENKKKNLIEASIYTGEGGAGVTPILDPRYYAPLQGAGVFSQAWSVWRVPDTTGASVSIEPPLWAKDAYNLYLQVLEQPTFELQVAKMREVLQEAKERFYVIGIARPAPMYYPFNIRLGGIPDTWYDGWNEGVQKLIYPEQWFLKP